MGEVGVIPTLCRNCKGPLRSALQNYEGQVRSLETSEQKLMKNVEAAYRPTVEQKPLEQIITDDIRKVRDAFLNRAPDQQNASLTYDPHMDIALYQTLNKYRVTESPAYASALKSVNSFTHFQLETMIGEACHVLLSDYTLKITPDGLYSPQGKELLRTIMRRGRDYRRNQGSKVTERENAEVDGFELVTEPFLRDPKRKSGDSVASISRPDGPYTKNFYDVFTVIGSGEDQYVRVRRYSSGLSTQDYVEKIPQLGVRYQISSNPTDAFFLSHPILIDASSKYSNPDTLHAFFHKTHSYMNTNDFEKIRKACHPLIDSYIDVLQKNPYDQKTIAEKFKAILNGIEAAKEILEEERRRERMKGAKITSPLQDERIIFTARDILRFERQEAKPQKTGCGILVGMNEGGDSMNPLDRALRGLRPSSVSDFRDEDDLGGREFDCKVCSHRNRRPYNEKIPRCQNDRCPDPTNVAC